MGKGYSMAYYRDLDPCTYFGLESDDPPVEVEWLDKGTTTLAELSTRAPASCPDRA
jgi:hypothetical protein